MARGVDEELTLGFNALDMNVVDNRTVIDEFRGVAFLVLQSPLGSYAMPTLHGLRLSLTNVLVILSILGGATADSADKVTLESSPAQSQGHSLTMTDGSGANLNPQPHVAEEDVIESIQRRGGKIVRDADSPSQPVVSVDLDFTETGDVDLKNLATFKNLRKLYLNGTKVTVCHGVRFVWKPLWPKKPNNRNRKRRKRLPRQK